MEINVLICKPKNIRQCRKEMCIVDFKEEDTVIQPFEINMYDLLIIAGVFYSKSQARKNWKKEIEIPYGYNEFILGKKKNKVCVWKPIIKEQENE